MARLSKQLRLQLRSLTVTLSVGIGIIALLAGYQGFSGHSDSLSRFLPLALVSVFGVIFLVLLKFVRQSVRQLDRERLQLATVFESLAEGVVIQDASGAIVQFNAQAGYILGLTSEELLGKKSVDPDWQAIHEDGTPWPGLEHPAMVTLRTGQPIRNAVMGIRSPVRGQRWLEINTQAILDTRGQPGMVVASFADVTASRQQMDRLDLTISGAGLGTWDWNIQTGQVVFNDIWAKMLGYELAEIEPNVSSWEKIVDPEAAPSIMALLEEHLRGNTPIYRSEHRLLRKDGSWMWVLDTGQVVERDSAGNPLRALGVHVDITATKEMERRLRESDQQFLAIFDQTAHLLWVLSPEGKVQNANQAALKFTDVRLMKLLGRQFADSPWLAKSLGQDNLMRMAIARAAAGEFVRFELATYSDQESQHRRSIGHFDFSIKPVFSADGVVFSLVAEALDITEAVCSREELHLAQERLEHATRNARLGVWDWNPQIDEAWYSEQWFAMLGYGPYEFPSKGAVWLELLHPQDQPGVMTELQRYLDGDLADKPSEFRLEFRMRHKDNSWRWILSVGRVTQRDELGRPCRVSGVHFDETERKQMQSQRAQAQRLESIGQLAAGVAHEINTPMQFVSDNLEYLVEGIESAEQVIERLEKLVSAAQGEAIGQVVEPQWLPNTLRETGYARFRQEAPGAVRDCRDGCQRVVTIVHAMRQLSHPGNDGFHNADLNEIIHGATIVTRNRWKFVADVRLELEPNLPSVPCRAAELSQVLVNMIVNAADAMEAPVESSQPTGQITIRTQSASEHVRITVQDNGSGIPPEVIDRIFDPFFTTKPVGQGTGQGLAIAHDIVVSRHRGGLRAESEPGKGTTFTIELPLVQEVAATL